LAIKVILLAICPEIWIAVLFLFNVIIIRATQEFEVRKTEKNKAKITWHKLCFDFY